MRLCFIGDPRSIHTQRWVRWFAGEHEVTFVATADDAALAEYRVCTLPGPARTGLRLPRSVAALRRVLAAHRPDILHAHYINEPGWLAAASRWRGTVITAWGSDLYRAPAESRLARRLNPWAVRSADWVTCDSVDQTRVLRAWGVHPDRLSVIGWGVDREQFHPGVDARPLRARVGIPLDANVVLSPRQWLPNSNIEPIVEAHARLPSNAYLLLKRMPRFEGAAASRVEAVVDASPARDRIRVLEEIAAEELPSLYAAADVIISLCTTDGTPVSVLEGMALGRPVVALQNPSLAEWVGDPGGKLLPSLDPGELADALQGYLASPAARQEAAACNLDVIARRADRAREMGRMADIYERLAQTGPAPEAGRGR